MYLSANFKYIFNMIEMKIDYKNSIQFIILYVLLKVKYYILRSMFCTSENQKGNSFKYKL